MIEDLKTIYKGHATVIKNKEYYTPEKYIQPFIDKLKPYTNKFICQVKMADQLSVDDEINTVYNKVLIMGIFPDSYDVVTSDERQTHYHRIVCMAYALDVKTPTCKFYTGVVDGEMNFYAFGTDCINIQKVLPDTAFDYTPVNNIINKGSYNNRKSVTGTWNPFNKLSNFLIWL